MAWGRRCQQRPSPQAAPVVEKTPEQLAEEEADRQRHWEERNPLRRWLITFMDGTEHTVTAHRYSDGTEFTRGRLMFMRTRYGVMNPYRSSYLSEVVYWTHVSLVRSVKMLDD